MSEREKAIQLLNAYLQGAAVGEDELNAETIAAIQELENGGGECFDTLGELWQSLEE